MKHGIFWKKNCRISRTVSKDSIFSSSLPPPPRMHNPSVRGGRNWRGAERSLSRSSRQYSSAGYSRRHNMARGGDSSEMQQLQGRRRNEAAPSRIRKQIIRAKRRRPYPENAERRNFWYCIENIKYFCKFKCPPSRTTTIFLFQYLPQKHTVLIRLPFLRLLRPSRPSLQNINC